MPVWPLLALVAAIAPCEPVVTFDTGLEPSRVLYVSTTGSDAGGDGTRERPYRTVVSAAGRAGPGTAVRVLPGTYTGGFVGDLRGRADAPIWIGGEPGSERPRISGGVSTLQLSRARYVVLHDMEIHGGSGNGVNLDDGGEVGNPNAAGFITLRNLLVRDIGAPGCNCDGIKLSGIRDFAIVGCVITRCGGSAPGPGGSGIDLVGCHRGIIADCELADLSASGIQAKGGSADVRILRCTFRNAGLRALNIGGSTGFAFFRPPLSVTEPNAEARRIRVESSIFIGGDAAAAFVGALDCSVSNCTIIRPGRGVRILQETLSQPPYTFAECADNAFTNTIVHFERAAVSQGRLINIGPDTRPDTFTFSHNLWYAFDRPGESAPPGTVTHTKSIIGEDPRFESEPADLRLRWGSPAIGAGSPAFAPRADARGRCFAAPPSIGAFEGLCPADFNGDGQVEFFDYLDFVQAFADEDPSADFNRDGQVDFFDYLDFVAAFAEGCD